jgi:Tfp pilus assembly protein PilP
VRQQKGKRNSISICLLVGIVCIPVWWAIPDTLAQQDAAVNTQNVKPPTPSPQPGEGTTGEEKVGDEPLKEEYFYDPTNKVDPFKSFIVVKRELEEEREKEAPRTYLETLDLSQLTITAIVLGSQDKFALVKDSKGEGHVIKIGTSIGRKRGQVIKILEKEVIVREHDTDIRGNELVTDISMKLPEAD